MTLQYWYCIPYDLAKDYCWHWTWPSGGRQPCGWSNPWFVVEVNTILIIISNSIGVICTLLIKCVKSRASFHLLGPHRINITCCSQSVVQLCSAFYKQSKNSGRFILKSRTRKILVALLRRRVMTIILYVRTGSLISWIGISMVIWQWSLVVWGKS